MHASAVFKALGAIVALVGAWAALVAYVGPTFGYPMPPGSDQPAWDWSASHTWRHLLPGVAAVVGGALILSGRRPRVLAGSAIAFLAGTWMIISPFVVRAWLDTGGGGGGDASTVMQIITPLGYHHVPGVVTVALSSFVLGRLLGTRAALRREEDVPRPARDERPRDRDRDGDREREPAHV